MRRWDRWDRWDPRAAYVWQYMAKLTQSGRRKTKTKKKNFRNNVRLKSVCSGHIVVIWRGVPTRNTKPKHSTHLAKAKRQICTRAVGLTPKFHYIGPWLEFMKTRRSVLAGYSSLCTAIGYESTAGRSVYVCSSSIAYISLFLFIYFFQLCAMNAILFLFHIQIFVEK